MALAFLLNKKFHPATLQNQKRLYIAEEKARDQQKRQKEYEKQLLQEKEYLDARKALSGKLDEDEGKRGVSFMYEPPPGYLAAVTAAAKVETEVKPDDRPEWAKNAPVAGAYTEGMKVNFRPLGIEVRNMRCIRCGERGHSTGDRECKMKDHNPNGSKPGSTKFVMKSMEREVDPTDPNSQMLAESEEEADPEYEFLANLSEKEKKKLLKDLKKKRKEKKHKKDKEHKHSSSKSSKGSKKSKSRDGDESADSDSSDDSGDESEKSEDSHRKKKKHSHKKDKGSEKSKVHKK